MTEEGCWLPCGTNGGPLSEGVSGWGTCSSSKLALSLPFPPRPPQPGLPRAAPPVSAGSALSGCDIHPDEQGAPRPGGPAEPLAAPCPGSPCPGRAPRPSRRTGTPGPLRGSGGRVVAPPAIHWY